MELYQYLIIALAVILVGYTIFDVIRICRIKTKPTLPILENKEFDLVGPVVLIEHYRKNSAKILAEEKVIEMLNGTVGYINNRYDCSDFHMHLILRLYKSYGDKLPQSAKELLKKTFLNFKYWVDMPDDESMCYFSENHTLLFASLEFLIGQEWKDEIFVNSGFTGAKHMARGKQRLLDWFDQKYKYGFFEWYSGNYWNEDFGGLFQLLSYSEDKEISNHAKIMLDYMYFEIATHSVEGRFVTVSSRQYGDNKFINKQGNRLSPSLNYIINGIDEYDAVEHSKLAVVDCCLLLCNMDTLRSGKYLLPDVIKEIFNDKTEQIIKTSNGLNPDEYKKLGLIGQSDYQLMAQLSNEIFVNKGFAYNTYLYHKRNNTFASAFSMPIKYADIFPLRQLRLFPALCNILGKRFVPTGSALNRGNVYTYRKNGYMLATAVKCYIDYFGNQHHTMHANIAEDLNIFTIYPASVKNLTNAPGYWGGQRRMPSNAQDNAIGFSIYKVDNKQRLGEVKPTLRTHILFPIEKMDEYKINEKSAIGRKGDTFFAVVCNKALSFEEYNIESARALVRHVQSNVLVKCEKNATDQYMLKDKFDLVAKGLGYHCYVIELSDKERESYEEFITRIENNLFLSENDTLLYNSCGKNYKLNYSGEFLIDDVLQNSEFKRCESSYCKVERGTNGYNIACNGKKLNIKFDKIN
ncbi:MAG: hypothetical protein WCR54_02045 [Clostridia bacterium]